MKVVHLLMFVSTFVTVFLLGIQSKNVQHGRILAAVCTSFGISASSFFFTKFAATGGIVEFLALAAGGCAGIASAIVLHNKLVEARAKQ